MTFLSEFVDGGPNCSRDDCMIAESTGTQSLSFAAKAMLMESEKNTTYKSKRCLTCGRGWTEIYQNGIKISTL